MPPVPKKSTTTEIPPKFSEIPSKIPKFTPMKDSLLQNVLEKQASEKFLPADPSSTIVTTIKNIHGKESFVIPQIPSE